MKSSRRMIIFEGIDGAGKTTLEDAYRKRNQFHDYTIHRLMASKYVYAKLFGRSISVTELLMDEEKLKSEFDVKMVLITCNPKIAQIRKNLSKEDHDLIELTNAQGLFREYFMMITTLPIVMVDTSKHKNVEQTLEECYGSI